MIMLEEAVKVVTQNGVLGAILVIFGIVIYSLFKLLMEEKDKRLNDVQEMSDKWTEPISQIKKNTELLNTLTQGMMNTMTQILDKVKNS